MMQQKASEHCQRQPSGTLELGEDEAYVIVKAAPRRSETYGETVCCAGLNRDGHWVRLYPVSFRQLDDAQRFKRWDKIHYRWSKPKATKDVRIESRRVDPHSIEIIGTLPGAQRNRMMSRCAVTSLRRERQEGRSLALLKAEVLDFWYEKRSQDDLEKQKKVLEQLKAQQDMFAPKSLVPSAASPFAFRYRYRDDDGEHEGTCQDWETEQTFLARRRDQGSEAAALEWMVHKFGEEYPRRGMALAMGTHRHRPDQWLINGVIRLDDELQLPLI